MSTSTAKPPEIFTRRPTGRPAYPLILLSGVEKAGKSYSAAEFSGSVQIGQTYWLPVGDPTADEYGAVPGADYDLLPHDGTFHSIVETLRSAVAQPRSASRGGRPNLIVIDSMTRLWELLVQEQQELANARNRRRAALGWKPVLTDKGEAVVAPDQWSAAKKRWREVVNLLRGHDGPVVLTARIEPEDASGETGRPESDTRRWKVRADKDLVFDVSVIVQFRTYREAIVTGAHSLSLRINPGEVRAISDFTVDKLLDELGLSDLAVAARREQVVLRPEAVLTEESEQWAAELRTRIENASSLEELKDIGGQIGLVRESERLNRRDEERLKQIHDARMRELTTPQPPAAHSEPGIEDDPFPDQPPTRDLISPDSLLREIKAATSHAALDALYARASGWYHADEIILEEATRLRRAIDARRAELGVDQF